MGRRAMDARYDDLSDYGFAIDDFNKAVPPDRCRPNPANRTFAPPTCSLLVVADELADLMMVALRDVEASIQRNSSPRARRRHPPGPGLSAPRPIVTGLIKVNIPRTAASDLSLTDSRTISTSPVPK